jgi:hypothetical protein
VFQVGLGKKHDRISKITRAKRAGGLAQVVGFKSQYHERKKERKRKKKVSKTPELKRKKI